MNELEEIIAFLREKPYLLKMGAYTVSKRFNIDIELFKQARDNFKNKTLKTKLIHKEGPKILIFDVETAPMRAYIWSRWKQNIYLDQTISEWFMLTWSAKWLFSKEIISNRLTGKEVLKEDDSRIVKELWKLFDTADIVIAHNAKGFDILKCNSRFILNGLYPPSYYKVIDTKEIAAKHFGFSSNKLDALAQLFHIPVKLHTGFELWSKCMEGDEKSLKYMEKYNKHDVEILEEVYLTLLPYIKGHPNYNLYIDSIAPVCPTCGGTHLESTGYYYYTPVSKYENFRCVECGS